MKTINKKVKPTHVSARQSSPTRQALQDAQTYPQHEAWRSWKHYPPVSSTRQQVIIRQIHIYFYIFP